MIEIKRGCLADYDRTIDFIDLVFSKAHCPHNFETMYPNLYRKLPGYPEHFYNLWEDGELRGCVICEPRTISVCGKKLYIGGIGNVAVHPKTLGKGYMSAMMNHIVADMKQKGFQLSELGGKRSRYAHFGYEIAGNEFSIGVDPDEIRKKYPELETAGWDFRTVSYGETDRVNRLKAYYDSLPYHIEYDYDHFFLRMEHNFCKCWEIFAPDGSSVGFTGFRATDQNIGLLDLYVPDALRADALMALSLKFNRPVHCNLQEAQVKYMGKAFAVSGNLERRGAGMYNIFDWPGVIEALLTYKSTYQELAKGRMVIQVEEDVTIAVAVGDTVSVQQVQETPEAVFDHFTALRALTGSYPYYFFQNAGLTGDRLRLAADWFPVPLFNFGGEMV